MREMIKGGASKEDTRGGPMEPVSGAPPPLKMASGPEVTRIMDTARIVVPLSISS